MAQWLVNAIFYEIYPQSFLASLDGRDQSLIRVLFPTEPEADAMLLA